jgi:hypothetical protein
MGRRLGPAAGLADLDDAVGYALGTLGLPVADPLRVVDADLAAVTSHVDSNQVDDVVEWRMIEAILNNLTDEELLKVGVLTAAKDYEPILRRRAERLAAWIRDTYAVGLAPPSIGVIDWNFQQRGCPPCG